MTGWCERKEREYRCERAEGKHSLEQLICHLCSLDSERSDDNLDVFEGASEVNQFGSKGVERVGGGEEGGARDGLIRRTEIKSRMKAKFFIPTLMTRLL